MPRLPQSFSIYTRPPFGLPMRRALVRVYPRIEYKVKGISYEAIVYAPMLMRETTADCAVPAAVFAVHEGNEMCMPE